MTNNGCHLRGAALWLGRGSSRFYLAAHKDTRPNFYLLLVVRHRRDSTKKPSATPDAVAASPDFDFSHYEGRQKRRGDGRREGMRLLRKETR